MFETLRNLFGRKRPEPDAKHVVIFDSSISPRDLLRVHDEARTMLIEQARATAPGTVKPWDEVVNWYRKYAPGSLPADIDAAFPLPLPNDLVAAFQKLADDAVIEAASEPLRTMLQAAKANAEGSGPAGIDVTNMTDAEYEAHLSKRADDAGKEGSRS